MLEPQPALDPSSVGNSCRRGRPRAIATRRHRSDPICSKPPAMRPTMHRQHGPTNPSVGTARAPAQHAGGSTTAATRLPRRSSRRSSTAHGRPHAPHDPSDSSDQSQTASPRPPQRRPPATSAAVKQLPRPMGFATLKNTALPCGHGGRNCWLGNDARMRLASKPARHRAGRNYHPAADPGRTMLHSTPAARAARPAGDARPLPRATPPRRPPRTATQRSYRAEQDYCRHDDTVCRSSDCPDCGTVGRHARSHLSPPMSRLRHPRPRCNFCHRAKSLQRSVARQMDNRRSSIRSPRPGQYASRFVAGIQSGAIRLRLPSVISPEHISLQATVTGDGNLVDDRRSSPQQAVAETETVTSHRRATAVACDAGRHDERDTAEDKTGTDGNDCQFRRRNDDRHRPRVDRPSPTDGSFSANRRPAPRPALAADDSVSGDAAAGSSTGVSDGNPIAERSRPRSVCATRCPSIPVGRRRGRIDSAEAQPSRTRFGAA